MAAGIAAGIAVAATWQAISLGIGPPRAEALTLDSGEVLELQSGPLLAIPVAIYALLWWLPAVGVCLRRRWGLNLGMGIAAVTLLFGLSLALLAGPKLRQQGMTLSTPGDWAMLMGAAAFFVLAWSRRRRDCSPL
ncbi:MAG: hypothetical protein HY320_08440 [Armatimonadetes bacterium]|nr:hypothetical protein [Armatimonadota bacterium]